MTGAAAHHHLLLALAHVIHHRLLGVELFAVLIEVSHFQVGAPFDRAATWAQLAEQQLDQGRLATAVGADQRNLVATQHLQIQPLKQGAIAKVETQAFTFKYQLAGAARLVQLQLGLALQFTTLGTLHAHRLEGAHSPLIAGAAGLDPLAYPHLFLGQLAIELGIFQLLDPQPLLLALQVLVVVAGPGGDHAAIQIDDPGRQLVDELPVVGDEDNSAAKIFEELFQPVDGIDVQVVGRLVQQQQIRIAGQRASQCYFAQPTAGEAVEGHVGIQTEQGQHLVDASLELPAVLVVELLLQLAHLANVGIGGIVCQLHGDMVILLEQLPYPGQPFGGVVKHGELARGGGILLEAGHFQVLLQHQTAVIERQFAGDHLHQGGLARPVAPHQTEALAPLDGELGLVEQRKITERQGSAVQCQKSHSCSFLLMKKRAAD